MKKSVDFNRQVITFKDNAILELSEDFMTQVKYLCNKIAHVEWSGYVFYSVEGDFKDLKTLKFIPYYIHPMHKGSAGATEFDSDGSLAQLYKEKPELDPFENTPYRYGKIHSHHSMDVYHSQVDWQDLQDQAGSYEFYLSVIVNNAMEVEAKLAFIGKLPAQPITTDKFEFTSKLKLPEKEVLAVIDFDIKGEGTDLMLEEQFIERVDHIIEEAKKPTYSYTPSKFNGMSGLEDFEDDTHLGTQLKTSTKTHNLLSSEAYSGRAIVRGFIESETNEKNLISYDAMETAITKLKNKKQEKLYKSAAIWASRLNEEKVEKVSTFLQEAEIDEYPMLDTLTDLLWNAMYSTT